MLGKIFLTAILATGVAFSEGKEVRYAGGYDYDNDGNVYQEEKPDTSSRYDNGERDRDRAREENGERYENGDSRANGNDRCDALEVEDRDALTERRESKRFGMGGFGPATLNSIDSDPLSYDFYGGYIWEVSPMAAVKGLADITTDFNKAALMSANLGANFYPVAADVSPFVGADLGLGVITSEGDADFGFVAGASIGAQLFRLSTTQMNLEAMTKFHFDGDGESTPYKVGGRIGVLF
jgi:hypothetical protein